MSAAPDNSSPTIHHDQLSGRDVFIAPRRAERPNDLGDGAGGPCPFCRGNEHLTAADIVRWPEPAVGSWKTRIVPNRYPVVEPITPGNPADHKAADQQPAITAAHGLHEVVIESAEHVASVLDVPAQDWHQVWKICQRRLGQLAEADEFCWATVFKNGGAAAGASLEHLHSQLIAIDRVPPTVLTKCQQLAGSPELFGALLANAAASDRIVSCRGGVIALVPPAPRQPFEVWLVPDAPAAFFHRASEAEVVAVAELTRCFAAAVEQLVPGGSYNWWLHQFPDTAPAAVGPLAEHWHWHLEIMPRLAPLAGFELGTGCHISTVDPPTAARLLRETSCW